jgi:hypothetical protein
MYVSGAGTDSSERGRSMWARVKGKTEKRPDRDGGLNACLPARVDPTLHGARSKTRLYRVAYVVMAPVLGGARWLFPRPQITTTGADRLAMLHVARSGAPNRILESPETSWHCRRVRN